MICSSLFFFFFFFNDTATTEIYTLSLHDALPIFFHQLLDVPGTTIGEFSLGQRPDAFIGVEVRRVGGKMLDFETRVSSTKFLERFPLMRGGVIQQNDDRATQMPQQLTQEHTNFLLADVLKKQEIVEAQAAPLGTDRNSRDDREFVPPSLPMPMDGGFPLRSPGPNHRGD